MKEEPMLFEPVHLKEKVEFLRSLYDYSFEEGEGENPTKEAIDTAIEVMLGVYMRTGQEPLRLVALADGGVSLQYEASQVVGLDVYNSDSMTDFVGDGIVVYTNDGHTFSAKELKHDDINGSVKWIAEKLPQRNESIRSGRCHHVWRARDPEGYEEMERCDDRARGLYNMYAAGMLTYDELNSFGSTQNSTDE